jgi:hypothetical protein
VGDQEGVALSDAIPWVTLYAPGEWLEPGATDAAAGGGTSKLADGALRPFAVCLEPWEAGAEDSLSPMIASRMAGPGSGGVRLRALSFGVAPPSAAGAGRREAPSGPPRPTWVAANERLPADLVLLLLLGSKGQERGVALPAAIGGCKKTGGGSVAVCTGSSGRARTPECSGGNDERVASSASSRGAASAACAAATPARRMRSRNTCVGRSGPAASASGPIADSGKPGPSPVSSERCTCRPSR